MHHPVPTSPTLQTKSRLSGAATWLVALVTALGSLELHGATHPRVVITPAPGFSITWDGNNGGFNSPDAGAGPSNNVALASNGTVPFTSSDLGPLLSIPFHVAANLNDGLYGNSHSWISANGVGGTSDPDPYAALSFGSPVSISSIAWGRDNGDTSATEACGGTCTDRAVGLYTLQYTTTATPDISTPDTGDAATGWANLGTIEFLAGAEDVSFTSYLRHRFDVAEGGAAIAATGLRIKVSSGLMAIDEIEVNPMPDPVPPISNFIEINPAAGFSIAWDSNEGLFSTPSTPAPAPVNDASLVRGATAFGSSQLDFGVHFITNVNDGLYGNTHSWIPNFAAAPVDNAPAIGIRFGSRVLLRNIAWGRDNGDVAGDCCGGTLTDRALGTYVVQFTTAPNPGPSTPEACGPTPDGGWVTLGTIHYKSDNPAYFNSYLRHRFDVAQGGNPIPATGIRILPPSNTSAIDEIEVNGNVAIEQNVVRITNAAGSTVAIQWDGNDGQFNNPDIGAAPPPNRGLATEGTTPFASSDLGPVLGIPFHRAVNLNDGLYGNANSWISANGTGGTTDTELFAGLAFGSSITLSNIAWSRDNGNVAGDCCGGTLSDRVLGTYRLQFTSSDSPDATTAETGDAATGWADLGTVTYVRTAAPFFTPHLRHRFDLVGSEAVQATGIRIKVPDGSIAIDEIEINTALSAPPAPAAVGITGSEGRQILWDGNDGHFFDPEPGAAPPSNRALASAGTTAFTSSDLGPVLAIPFHVAANLNDGRYGNSFSWISANGIGGTTDPLPYAALNFNGTVAITNIAWSRDNGDNVEFQGTDRVLGAYTLQFTQVATPDGTTADTGEPSTGWATLGVIDYRRSEPPDFNPHLRHRFDVSEGGEPIQATGLRILVPNGLTDIDEIEINTVAQRPAPIVRITRDAAGVTRITWIGGGGLEVATNINGPWACIPTAISPYIADVSGESTQRFYRVRR